MVDIKASSRVEDNAGVPLARQLATSMLSDAGFTDIRIEEIETDPINYYIARK